MKPEEHIKGDANDDGSVSSVDFAAVLKYLLNGEELEKQGITNADMNGDYKVNTVDLIKLKNLLLS